MIEIGSPEVIEYVCDDSYFAREMGGDPISRADAFDDFFENRGVFAGKGREDLAIKADPFFLQCVDKAAVRCAALSTGRVDLDLPERAERALLCPAVAKGVDAGLEHRRPRELDGLFAAVGVALDRFEKIFSFFEVHYPSFDSRHICGD